MAPIRPTPSASPAADRGRRGRPGRRPAGRTALRDAPRPSPTTRRTPSGGLRILTAAALAVLAPLPRPAGLAAQGVGLPLGAAAPDVTLEDLEGNPVQLMDHVGEGKPALLEFWATWCENCEALQPQLDRIQAEHGDEISVVAVAVAVSQSQRRVRRHVEEHGAGYPYLWDGRGEAVRAYNAATTSIVLLLDGDRRVVYSGVGADQDLVGEVERLLGG